MLLRGKHYRTREAIDVTIDRERIESVVPAGTARADVVADIIAPALVDLQINGAQGISFTSDALAVEDVLEIARICQEHGIGVFCPTVITASAETICHAFKTLAAAGESDPRLAESMPVFHLEGPYISPQDGPRGAHPLAHVRPAGIEEYRRFQDAAGGRIRLVTLAPEIAGALPLIETLKREGVRVAIGHSSAPPAVIRDAVRAGATLSTHLGNGCARQLPRHENLLWEQLAADELTASVIPDGHHLPWTLVKCILRCKGKERVIVTCDASPLAGLPPGKYQPWGDEIEVLPEGKIVLRSQGVLAGSWDFTNRCVEKLLQEVDGLDLAQVHDMASQTPARFLGLAEELTPRITAGAPAKLVAYGRNDEGQWRMTHSIMDGRIHEISSTSSPGGAAGH